MAALFVGRRRIDAFPASNDASATGSVDAIVETLDLGASAASTGNGRAHARWRLIWPPLRLLLLRASLARIAVAGGGGEEIERERGLLRFNGLL